MSTSTDDPPDLLDGEPPDTDEILLTQSRIGSIPALRLDRFKQVARLCLRQNSIQTIDGLASLAATLTDLDLYDNLITRIRNLDDLTNLTSLDLSFNKIRHIKNIEHLTGLRELFLVSNKISRIENLETLTNLTSLELGANRIRTIENLDALSSLEELWLAKNKITDLTGLSSLPKLRLLSIQANRLRDLSPLADVPQLEELYVSDNALETLSGLESNTNLRVLEISNNKVKSLEGLAPLAELEELWASYNLIEDFGDVERALKDKKGLTTVYFEGNPLQLRGPALYRNKVRLALPQVSQIDASTSTSLPLFPSVFDYYGGMTCLHMLTCRRSLCQGISHIYGFTHGTLTFPPVFSSTRRFLSVSSRNTGIGSEGPLVRTGGFNRCLYSFLPRH